MILNEQTVKDIDKAFKALEAIEDIKAEIMKCRDMTKLDRVYAVHIIDKHIGAEMESEE